MQLLPRDLKFYDQLLGQSRLAVRAASVLRGAAQAGGPALAEASQQLRQMESEGDRLEQDVFRRLHKTFITPIDPEDIHGLSSALDRVLDAVEAIGYRLQAYQFMQIPERMRRLAGVLEQCTKSLDEIFETLNEHGLDQQDRLSEQCARVNQIESDSQNLAREGVTEAFAQERDPIQLVKLKTVYDHFEMAGDRCEDVADLIINLLAKNS